MKNKLFLNLEKSANLFELACVLIVILMASLFQFLLQELPCPLCLLQRVGFVGIAFGFLLNFRFGLRPSHYAIVILSALFTGFVALRQVVLHVIPGSGAYGFPFLGLHLYTWVFILSNLVIIGVAFLMSMDRQYTLKPEKNDKRWKAVTHVLFGLLTLLIITNIVSVTMECGFKACPDNPTKYEMMQ